MMEMEMEMEIRDACIGFIMEQKYLNKEMHASISKWNKNIY